MRRISQLSFLFSFLLVGSLLSASPLPQLFQKAKDQFRLGAYADALVTLSKIETEGEQPENQAYRAPLRPGIAFYRGACLAALGRDPEARAEFQVFLAFCPTVSLDPGMYPKKVISLLEETRRELKRPNETQPPAEDGSIAAAYQAYVRSSGGRQPELGEDWADGPVRYLLTSDERRAFSQMFNPVNRSEFVTAFWKARDPRPETEENEFREEFEKRVAFADSHFTEDELRGSLTDRGMAFVLLGPPTYVGRRPIRAGEDANAPSGDSRYSRNDMNMALAGGGASSFMKYDQMTGPVSKMLEPSSNWREVWHYRRELLPRGLPYLQVDLEFFTRRGYGKNVLQRDAVALNALDAARKAILVNRRSGHAAG
jgi:GWxTD domain-containing protein